MFSSSLQCLAGKEAGLTVVHPNMELDGGHSIGKPIYIIISHLHSYGGHMFPEGGGGGSQVLCCPTS